MRSTTYTLPPIAGRILTDIAGTLGVLVGFAGFCAFMALLGGLS